MTSTFFSHVKRRRPAALATKFLRDLESGLFETPKSFDVLAKFRTEELKLDKAGQRLRVAFPESPLILAFCKRYPQVCMVTCLLDPPLVNRCARCNPPDSIA